MLSVPGAKVVRGYSFFGDSFVYVLFEDGTDLYWARSRVLEYLNQVQGRLPPARAPALGPGRDRRRLDLRVRARRSHAASTTSRSCARCRTGSCATSSRRVPDVAEVATIGGMVRQYQIVARSGAARRYNLPLDEGHRGDPRREPRDRRLGGRAGRSRVHGARRGATCARSTTSAASRCSADEGGTPVLLRRRRAHPARAGDAPRHRRARRRGRSGRRRRRAALGQERAGRRSRR